LVKDQREDEIKREGERQRRENLGSYQTLNPVLRLVLSPHLVFSMFFSLFTPLSSHPLPLVHCGVRSEEEIPGQSPG
jgi:hypothetical protein